MHLRKKCAESTLYVALCLLSLPLAAVAQAAAPSDAQIWQDANAAVGQFRRGHADVLRWEQAHPQTESALDASGTALTLTGLQDAVRMAWAAQPGLRSSLARLDSDTRDALAAGRWDRIAARALLRVEDPHALLATTAQVRRDWANTLAAAASAQQAQEMLHAARSARDLGERMVRVGNWSRAQQYPWQIAEAQARMNQQRAQLGLVQAQGQLLRTLGQTGVFQTVAMPQVQHDLPPEALGEAQVEQRAAALRQQQSAAESLASRDHVFQAYAAYRAAYANARTAQDIQKLYGQVVDETVLHYNGMLKSTWDVLTQAQSAMQAAQAAANARRDFDLAGIDLDWALLGGEPALVNLGAADAAAPAAGH